MCAKCIDITAKSGLSSKIVSLRQNELISNLRLLVAMRFERACNIIVLVFGGQVLRDVGTIDTHGITSGVTVHVVFRQPVKEAPPIEQNTRTRSSRGAKGITIKINARSCCLTKSRKSHHRTQSLKGVDAFKLLNDPSTLRDIMQSDPFMKTMINEDASFRHYLGSDRNLRELISTIFNPAKVEELSRKRDMHIMRMEWVPGGYRLLSRLNYFMRQAHEDNVAMTYQGAVDTSDRTADNPQRGRENKLPLPNPWAQRGKLNVSKSFAIKAERMVVNLKQKCDHMMDSLKVGDLGKTLEEARELNQLADNARRQLELRVGNKLIPGPITALIMTPSPPASVDPPDAALPSLTLTMPSADPPAAQPAAPPAAASLNIFDFMSRNHTRWAHQFQSQLRQLGTLGHTDRQRNICALLMSFGNIQAAVRILEHWKR